MNLMSPPAMLKYNTDLVIVTFQREAMNKNNCANVDEVIYKYSNDKSTLLSISNT